MRQQVDYAIDLLPFIAASLRGDLSRLVGPDAAVLGRVFLICQVEPEEGANMALPIKRPGGVLIHSDEP